MTRNEKLLWRAVNSSVYASITDVNFDISLSCGWPFGLLVYVCVCIWSGIIPYIRGREHLVIVTDVPYSSGESYYH